MKTSPAMQERIARIQTEIKGVKSQYGIKQWELDFMDDMVERDIAFGSKGQNDVIAKIEAKVFDEATMPDWKTLGKDE